MNARVNHGAATTRQLPPPDELIRSFPVIGTPIESFVAGSREGIKAILAGEDDRLLLVMGPCSVHDPVAALEYARNLKELRDRYADTLEIVMRVYFEKPRTTVGWKGLINDPYLDQSFCIDDGLRIARRLLLEINRLGVPAGGEFLDVVSPQYIGDLIAWGAIGARTTESQVHRELASGISSPIGFKNGTDGSIRVATDAMQAASRSHHFLSVDKTGHVAIVQTAGNLHCHLILRGGRHPNYDPESIEAACSDLHAAQLRPAVMVDCSHANSAKQHLRQLEVAKSLAGQIAQGSERIFGVMVESNLVAGAQKFTPGKDPVSNLQYGKSITDACLGWANSMDVAEILSQAVLQRRLRRAVAKPVELASGYVHRVDSMSPDAAFSDLVDVPSPGRELDTAHGTPSDAGHAAEAAALPFSRFTIEPAGIQ